MTDLIEGTKEDPERQRIESRRNFLKVSVAAGATVGALAAAGNLVPTVSAATSAKSLGDTGSRGAVASIDSNQPLVISVKGDKVEVYQGETKTPIVDASLARKIASTVRASM